jgi:hypothetical protein
MRTHLEVSRDPAIDLPRSESLHSGHHLIFDSFVRGAAHHRMAVLIWGAMHLVVSQLSHAMG